MQVAIDSELAQDDDVVDIEDVELESAADDADGEPTPPSKKPMAAPWRATLFGLAMVVVLQDWSDGWGFASTSRTRRRPSEVSFCRWPGRAR